RNKEGEGGFEQVVFGPLAIVDNEFKFTLELRVHGTVVGVDLFFSKQAGFDAKRQIDFLFSVQQGDLTDLLQVVLHGVSRSTGRHDLLDRGVVVIGVRVDESGSGGRCLVFAGYGAVLDIVVSDFNFL